MLFFQEDSICICVPLIFAVLVINQDFFGEISIQRMSCKACNCYCRQWRSFDIPGDLAFAGYGRVYGIGVGGFCSGGVKASCSCMATCGLTRQWTVGDFGRGGGWPRSGWRSRDRFEQQGRSSGWRWKWGENGHDYACFWSVISSLGGGNGTTGAQVRILTQEGVCRRIFVDTAAVQMSMSMSIISMRWRSGRGFRLNHAANHLKAFVISWFVGGGTGSSYSLFQQCTWHKNIA